MGSVIKIFILTLPKYWEFYKLSNFVVGIAIPRLSGDALSRHHSVEVFPVEKEMSNILYIYRFFLVLPPLYKYSDNEKKKNKET